MEKIYKFPASASVSASAAGREDLDISFEFTHCEDELDGYEDPYEDEESIAMGKVSANIAKRISEELDAALAGLEADFGQERGREIFVDAFSMVMSKVSNRLIDWRGYRDER